MWQRELSHNGLNRLKHKYSLIRFIDRGTYNSILSKDYTLEDLAKELEDFLSVKETKLSVLAKAYITYLNLKLANILFDVDDAEDGFNAQANLLCLNQKEIDYIKAKFKEDLNKEEYLEKYYELAVLPNNLLLFIVEDGFLKNITESKSNFLEFTLSCLCEQYKFKHSLTDMLHTYIKLRINDNYFNVVNLKKLAIS